MGVYHFAGLGKSVGAITAVFSYLSAIRQQGGAKAEMLFGLSDERDHADKERGMVQALVLFTTPTIARGERSILCDAYINNQAGRVNGREQDHNRTVKEALASILQKELKAGGMVLPDKKTLDIYWCEHERHKPLETFERAYTVLQAAKPEGRLGKECWINLTGGSNVINGALQLATAFLGTAARQYYILSDEPRCIHHTVPPRDLGTIDDQFWVDLPIVYANFNKLHRTVLEELVSMPEKTITHEQLHGQLYQDAEISKLIDIGADGDRVLRRTILQPMRSQRLIEHFPHANNNRLDRYAIGSGWTQMERYLAIIDKVSATQYQSLSEIEAYWFRKEPISLD